jgi:Domain of unknown function (DUF5130)
MTRGSGTTEAVRVVSQSGVQPGGEQPRPWGVGFGPVPKDKQPFTARQLWRLDEALTLASLETGLTFSVYVGVLQDPTHEHAERLHAQLGQVAPNSVLIAVSPGQRTLDIVTGERSAKRLPDRSLALAALSMRAAFSAGDLTGGLVNGLRMLADQAGRER